MAIIKHPISPLPGKLRGLHLFGFAGAPCAQRVRFAMGEKGLTRSRDIPWDNENPEWLEPVNRTSYISRSVSLPRKQHMTEAYAAIHPNMVVPALVHDGVLYIESVDIIQYLDETWPENRLVPLEPEARQTCERYVQLAKDLHRSVRYMSFKWSFGKFAKLNEKQIQTLRRLEVNDSPEQLVAFFDEFSHDRISREVYAHHLQRLEGGFTELEKLFLLNQRPWICGDAFSMADIMWSIKMLRIKDCGYPFEKNYPAVCEWYQRATSRKGFIEGVWRDAKLTSRAFRLKAGIANFFHQGIAQMSHTAKTERLQGQV